MTHPLVDQLRFTRDEWLRGLEGVNNEDGVRVLGPMNSIAWTVGHLAWQEQRYWLYQVDGTILAPEVQACGSGHPVCYPDLEVMWAAWHRIVEKADSYLDSLTSEMLTTQPVINGRQVASPGTKMLRMIYHYWYHLGEVLALRQILGHTNLPQFVGDIDRVPYRPE